MRRTATVDACRSRHLARSQASALDFPEIFGEDLYVSEYPLGTLRLSGVEDRKALGKIGLQILDIFQADMEP